MQLKVFGIVIFALLSTVPGSASELRLKDGRTYVRTLSRALDIPMREYLVVFDNYKMSLPKSGDPSEFIAANSAMAKLANYGCDEIAWLNDGTFTLDWLYDRFLNRTPTDLERSRAILTNGQFDVYSNCMVLALHPEVILSRGSR
ncbi:MAG: hypothetical protein R2827_01060 [Bdellovibrionales bacterium]